MARAILGRDCKAQYADPIRFAAGDRVVVQRADTEFPGWHWCAADDGREGWVHESFLSGVSGVVVGTRDYSAVELTAPAGAVVDVLGRAGEWAWVQLPDGTRGWVLESALDAGRGGDARGAARIGTPCT